MEEIVGLSVKERARLVELEQVKAGRQTVVAASERLSISGGRARGSGRGIAPMGPRAWCIALEDDRRIGCWTPRASGRVLSCAGRGFQGLGRPWRPRSFSRWG